MNKKMTLRRTPLGFFIHSKNNVTSSELDFNVSNEKHRGSFRGVILEEEPFIIGYLKV